MSASVARLLRAAKAKIDTPEKWSQRATAMDAQRKAIWIAWPTRVGGSLVRMSAHAATLSAGGAIHAANAEAGKDHDWGLVYAALELAQSRRADSSGIYQDSVSLAETPGWIDRAIAGEDDGS